MKCALFSAFSLRLISAYCWSGPIASSFFDFFFSLLCLSHTNGSHHLVLVPFPFFHPGSSEINIIAMIASIIIFFSLLAQHTIGQSATPSWSGGFTVATQGTPDDPYYSGWIYYADANCTLIENIVLSQLDCSRETGSVAHIQCLPDGGAEEYWCPLGTCSNCTLNTAVAGANLTTCINDNGASQRRGFCGPLSLLVTEAIATATDFFVLVRRTISYVSSQS